MTDDLSPRPDVAESRRVRLDVRESLRRGEEPFARIMTTVKALAADEAMLLRAPFEPVPLYRVLGGLGFAHWTERHASDDYEVWFYRNATAAPARLDVRGLEPPQPMVRVLEALDALPPGGSLEVVHDRRPVFLYPQLDDRAFIHETDEPEPGVVRIRIRRPG